MNNYSASFSGPKPGQWMVKDPDGNVQYFDGSELQNVPESEEPGTGIGGPIGAVGGAVAGHAASSAIGSALSSGAPAAAATAAPSAPVLLPGFQLPTLLGSPGLAAAAPYAAAAALAAAGTTMGVHDGIKKWNQGHGMQQEGLLQGANSILSPALGFFNRTKFGNSGVGKAINKVVSVANPVTWPIGVADMLGINFWSGKDPDQQKRDAVRESLLSNGIIDENYGLTTKDGRTTNIGLDGSTKAYNIDFNRPNAAQAAAWLDPLSAMITGGDEKLRSDFTGYLVNAAYADDPRVLRNNISDLYQRLGVTPDQMDEFIDGSKLPDNVKAIFKQNVNSLTQKDNFGTIGQTPPTAAPPAAQPPVQQKDPNVQKPQAQPQQAPAPPPPGPPKNLNQIASLMSMQRSKK